jgi:hypothetical protein
VKCEPQASVAQPWDARINASVFEFGIKVGPDGCGRRLVLESVDADLDDVAASLHSPLDPIDELPMDQFRRLVLVGGSEVMPKVIHHVEGEEPQRQHGLDRVEMEGREVVSSQEGVFGKEVLNAPALGIDWHGGVSGHVAGGCDQREVLAVTPLFQQHPQRAVKVRHRRVDGRHVPPDGLVVFLQGNGVELLQAFGRRLQRGEERDAILGVEFLEQLPAGPLFVRDQEEVPSEDGACQRGQPVGDLGDGGAGGGGHGDERFLRRLVLGREGTDRRAVAVLLGNEGVLQRFTGVCFHVMGIDVDGVLERDLAEPHEALAERGLEVQAVLHGNGLEEAILRGRRRQKGEAGEQAQVGAAHRIDGTATDRVAENRREDQAEGEALRRQPRVLSRSQRRHEVRGAQWEEIGQKAEPTSTGGSQPAFEDGGDVTIDVVARDEAWVRLAGAIEDFGLLLDEEPRGEGGL